jgi:hypothetical protein
MKKLPATFLTIVLFLIFSSTLTLATPIPSIKLEILDPEIFIGETFEIDVIAAEVSASDELLAFAFDVIHSSSFTFNGASVNPGFFDDSALFPDTGVAGSAFPGISGGADIALASLSFTPSLAGTFSLVLYSDLADPNEGLFTVDYPQVDITTLTQVNVVSSIQEPGTLFLLGVALIGLAGFRKKFRKG